MNSFERMQALTQGKPVDRIGYAGWMHMPLVDRSPKDFSKTIIDFTEMNDWDFVKITYNGHFFPEAYGAQITYSRDPSRWNGTVHREVINHPMDYKSLKVLDAKSGVLAREVESTKRIVEHFKGKVPVLATVFTPLTWAQSLYSLGRCERIQKAMQYNPKELIAGLETITQSNLALLEELTKIGIDGIFYATQYGSHLILDDEQFATFARPYDLQLLDAIKEKTWLNLLHIHGYKQLMFDQFANYPVQGYSWEDKRGTDAERTSIAQARTFIGEKLVIGGIEQYHDFDHPLDRDMVKSQLKDRLIQALSEMGGSDRFVFAPGCVLPMDVPTHLFSLIGEVVREVTGCSN